MSTIQLILESLEKTKSDKTDRLDVLYREHSMWLQDQLNKIQDLIQPNSAVMAAVKEIEEKKLIAAPDMPISKKRKSPETAYQGPKQSPEQKRASLNFEELFVSIGLPSDPNRATKDVLLSALATLGLINVPAKTLKKDLIEMIKDQLSAQRRVSEQSSQNNVNTEEAPEEIEEVAQNDFVEVELEENTPATEQVEDTSSIEVEEAIPSEPEQVAPTYQSSPSKTPGRKGSLMLSTFRDMINNQVPAPAEPEKEKEARASIIESEFKNRYRASQIRKSQILENPEETISSQTTMESEFTQEEVEAEVVEENTVEEEEQAEEQVEEEPEEEVIEADGVEVAAEEEVVAEIEEEAEKEDEGTWMEVASPIKCAEPVHVEVTAPESLEGTGSSFSSTSESAKSDSSKSSLSSQSSAVAKKPGNLQSGQTSFLDKGPSKPVVPALEKAKQLKAAEEAKAAQKKKDLEQKQQLKANASKNPLTSPWSKFKTKPAAPTSKPAEEAQPAQKKGGIFGGLFNKNKTAEVKPPAFDISVVETKKNSLLSESTESSSGKLSAAPINELDVEVKSVSELVKEIEAPKPVVPRNEPITSKLDKVAISSIVQNYNQAIGNTPTKPAAPIIATVPVVEDQENIQPVAAPAPIKAAEVSPVKMVISTPSKQAPEQNVLREISNDALASKALYTPVQAPQPPVEEEEEEEPSDEYQIEDRSDSDEGSDSGTDDEEEREKKKQTVPEWARGDKLREALERQYGLNGHTPMDPDFIFPEVQTCSLEEIFGRREGLTRKYNNRTSSAHWDADQLTLVEKRQYRNHMGYDATQRAAMTAKMH